MKMNNNNNNNNNKEFKTQLSSLSSKQRYNPSWTMSLGPKERLYTLNKTQHVLQIPRIPGTLCKPWIHIVFPMNSALSIVSFSVLYRSPSVKSPARETTTTGTRKEVSSRRQEVRSRRQAVRCWTPSASVRRRSKRCSRSSETR